MVTTFSPMMEIIIKEIKNIRRSFTGSSNKIIPNIAVPAIPIPVQTAYAVPSGIVLTAWLRKYKLSNMATTTRVVGKNLVKPLVYFIPTAHEISNKPAIIKFNQAIFLFNLGLLDLFVKLLI